MADRTTTRPPARSSGRLRLWPLLALIAAAVDSLHPGPNVVALIVLSFLPGMLSDTLLSGGLRPGAFSIARLAGWVAGSWMAVLAVIVVPLIQQRTIEWDLVNLALCGWCLLLWALVHRPGANRHPHTADPAESDRSPGGGVRHEQPAGD